MGIVNYEIPGDLYYPPLDVISPNPLRDTHNKLEDLADVIKHYTSSSLETDGIEIVSNSLKVSPSDEPGYYAIQFEPLNEQQGIDFKIMHQRFLSDDCAGQGLAGAKKMQNTPGAWNPMEGCKVNKHAISKWEFFLPHGMPIAQQRSVTLLHYPPYDAMQAADYLNNTTLHRWKRLLEHVGVKDEVEQKRYWSILDINPIAAPGSGESEYPNDYFPIMMASVFFDNQPDGCDYIRSALDVTLNPPHNDANPYTLPLLVGGSPLYDPQAPGWFRVRYKDQILEDGSHALERNKYDKPMANITQSGFVRIKPDSKKLTPYIIANHMIAAGVTGRCCTVNTNQTPDIRVYEAQDLVAASFLHQYTKTPDIHPLEARNIACLDWFGNTAGDSAPVQSSTNPDNLKIIGALAQMDLYITYDPKAAPAVRPKYTFEQALARVEKYGGPTFNPCAERCGAKWSLEFR